MENQIGFFMIRQKKNKMTVKILFFFLFILLLQLFQPDSCSLAESYDPNLNWQVLEGDHFSVIFPERLPLENTFTYQQIAIHVTEIAEETYQQITPQFGEPFRPNQKIAIILENFSDSTYGFASALPHRTIRLNLTAPGFKSFNTQFDNWIKILDGRGQIAGDHLSGIVIHRQDRHPFRVDPPVE